MMRAPDPATGLIEPMDDEAPAPTAVIRPKLVLVMFVLGFPKMGVFVTLLALAPIWKLNRSLILKCFITFRFRFFEPGPLKAANPSAPICPGSGLTSSG